MEQDNRAIALRVVGLDQPGAIQEWWDMARATNLNEFEAALQRLQIPMFTVMYADRDGHILHVFNGEVPVRSGGQFDDWLDRVPGNTSATLWTETHPYSDLPRVLDPPSGWLQNANDPPWTTTLPQVLNPEDYPSYIAPHGPMWFRAQEAARMLMNDDQISFEELVQYKHSTRVSLADRLLDDLIPAVRQHGNSLAQQAADVLENWDRHTNADSRGAVLFAAWADAVDSPDLFAIPWTEASPLTTPDGLAHPAKAVSILEEVAAEIQASYGSLDVSWGEVFRLHAGDRTLPANGGPSSLGIFRHVWFAPHENKQFTAIGGDSYVAVVEFSDPVRAMALMSYGNATQPGFPESPNQLELFADQALRPVWRSRQDIEAHLVSRQVF
jgi:acyl-homoserine-lactone acylase